MSFYQKEDLFKKQYKIESYFDKIEVLTEYYKYHEDVPRLFMMPIAKIIHNYYDKKRRINYIKITKMLNGGQ